MPPTLGARPDRLGRRMRTLGGPATARAAGNSVITSDMRNGAAPAAYPGVASGGLSQSSTIEARNTGLITPTTPSLLRADQSRSAYGGGWADGRLTVRERGILSMTGTSKLSIKGSISGVPNPQQSGPPQPQYLMDNRTESWQIGLDFTGQEDNRGPFATTATFDIDSDAAPQNKAPAAILNYPGGRRFPLGNQGDPWTTVWGGTPHLVRPYGQRGPLAAGPEPKMFALPGDGSGARNGTIIQEGAPEDGPQKIRGGVPHGRHSPVANGTLWTGARLGSIPLQKPPRDDRPNPSKIAGQSMSQLYPTEGNPKSARTPRMSPAQVGRQAGVTGRFTGRRP
jgi:hypothetical protein